MFLELINGVALLLALSLLHAFNVRLLRGRRIIEHVTSGILFGGICVVGMMLPITLASGAIFDARTVVLSMVGLFCGPLAAIIAAVIAGGYRIWLGGIGAGIGVTSVISSTLLGLAYRYCHDKGWVKIGFPQFLVFGLLVQIVAVFLFIWFPDNIARDVMRNIAIPFIIIFTPATAFLGLLLLDTENRIKTDVALSASEARLRSIVDAIPDVLFILDEDGRYLEILSSNMTLLSAEKSKLIGRLIHDVLPQSVADMPLQIIKKTINNREQQTFEYERETLSGRRVFEARTQPFETPAGEKKAVVFLARDITAKREIEAALHESEQNYRLQSQRLTEVIWGTNIGTWEWNLQTGLRTYNERWAEIVGYTLEELSPVSNDTWEKLTHPDDLKQSVKLLERCFNREAENYSCELRMRHKDGSWVWVLDRGRVVEWTTEGEPIRMSGTHQDITESKKRKPACNVLQVFLPMLAKAS